MQYLQLNIPCMVNTIELKLESAIHQIDMDCVSRYL